ncbi:DUF5320 domain-containing protein [Candidatus Omnitrophota bacterium]
MPDLDGTGPTGTGPRTGRGRGICGTGIHNIIGKKSRTLGLLTLAFPAVTAVITDACKPDGISRRLFKTMKAKLTGTPVEKAVTGSPVKRIDENSNEPV